METFEAAEALEALAVRLRPKLHRYCARMTGSRIDGEDVVQDALLKAFAALPKAGLASNPEAWLFRIAHNAALDFLRRRSRLAAYGSDDELEGIAAADDVPEGVMEREEIVAGSLRTFMRLPTVQRSSVILMDVLEYSLEEIGAIMDCSVPAVKSALHRARTRLREFAREPEDAALPALREPERSRLARYVDRFKCAGFRCDSRDARGRRARRAGEQDAAARTRGDELLYQLRGDERLALRCERGGWAAGGARVRSGGSVSGDLFLSRSSGWTGGLG